MDNVLDLIKNYLDRHLDNPPENMTPESRLDEIGIDSLGLLELIFDLEDQYKISVPQDIPTPETVGQLIEIIEQYKPVAVNG